MFEFVVPQGEGLMEYTIRGIDPKVWKAIKVKAATEDTTIKALILALLAKAVGK